ncbi:ComEC/Rec2 family competence protein [Streptomyces gardneri]|uniref:ComEC/Rec2 family competence protein n=1 Tax=Streptomyces gardneri TaxID=66892 RepID=UPI0006BCDFDD|nr:ComEC/Rec2 family competence protein [Streptomyces gardneri]QPK45608.1 ComEC/Rec2 family competence protein [Streptomyces gardneri]WRK36953.1 ComEC/Rec2 family competence protein [Streptomyces venezuelae]CUM41254.1 ComEC/Rec2-related protein [Streptomyces venezuelae]
MNRAGGTGEEGPVDLRLVPLALAAWAAAACAVGVTGWWTVAGVTVCLVGAFALLAPVLARRLGAADGSRDAEGGGPDAPVASPVTPGWRLRATACAGVLLCAAAGAASAGLHAADLRRGPVPALAREYVRAQMEVTVTSDPRLTRPQVRGNAMAPVSVVLGGEVTRVERPGGAAHRTRAPVLLIVPPGEAREEWLRLLPSTRLRVGARLALPLRSGEPFAAILKVDGAGPPRIVGPPSAPQRTAGELRAGLRRATEGLAPNARALLPGLVVGDTSRIGPELRDAFEATDLTHLLAVSGSNLSVVLLLLIGRPGRAHQVERGGLAPRLGLSLRATAVAGGALTLAFVVVCRPDPSVLRAAACGLVVLLAIGTGRRRSLIPALATAVLLLVLYDPWLARSYGFLLSVLATGALLTVAPRWSEALRRRRVPGRLAEALAAALAAQAVCAPVVVVFAGRVSLVAIPANLFAELAVAPATVLGFAALALAQVWEPAAAGVAWVAGWPAGWIAGVARAGGELPGAQLAWPGGWWGGLVLALLTGLVVLGARRLPYRGWIAGFVAALILLVAVRPVPLTRWATGWPPPGWVFAMCQVGQGDATVLAAGGDAAVVVDAGPDPVPVDRCLRELGVRRVPLLVLTHFHADHVAGLAGVLRGRSVGAIQTTALEEPPAQAAFVRRTAAAAGVPLVRAGAGEHRRVGALEWRVVWPPAGPGGSVGGSVGGANDASVTLLVRAAGGLSLLLLGDLEPPAQRALLRSGPGLGPVDVLKVAHHGSAHQDPGLIRAVRPRLALVSAGRDNPYGHPSPRTVEALRAGGARVLRTDQDGAVAVVGAGRGLMAVARGG